RRGAVGTVAAGTAVRAGGRPAVAGLSRNGPAVDRSTTSTTSTSRQPVRLVGPGGPIPIPVHETEEVGCYPPSPELMVGKSLLLGRCSGATRSSRPTLPRVKEPAKVGDLPHGAGCELGDRRGKVVTCTELGHPLLRYPEDLGQLGDGGRVVG